VTRVLPNPTAGAAEYSWEKHYEVIDGDFHYAIGNPHTKSQFMPYIRQLLQEVNE
jgi:hypothetical protein